MTNARSKGSRNERGVAKLFSDWTGYEFARTPQSGGLNWKKKITTGDLVCIDETHGPRFKFTIECKFHADLDFSYLIDGSIGKKTNKLSHFWVQALKEGETVHKIPLLFVRRNGMKTDMHFVIMAYSTFLKFSIYLDQIKFKYGFMTYVGENMRIAIINSEDWFTLDYQVIHKLATKFLNEAP